MSQTGGGSSSSGISTKRKISQEEIRQKKSRMYCEVSDLSSSDIISLSEYLKGIAREKCDQEKSIKACEKFINTGNGHRLGESCGICLGPLLDNINSPAFGVLSYKCRCSINRIIHSRCMTSLVAASGGKCASCSHTFSVATTQNRRVKALKTFQVDGRGRTIDLTMDLGLNFSEDESEEESTLENINIQ